jgi:hypothetical protein
MRRDSRECFDATNTTGLYMNHAVHILQSTFYEEVGLRHYRDAKCVEFIWHHDDIGNSSFIFEGEENDTLCRSGPLPHNHVSGNLYSRAHF